MELVYVQTRLKGGLSLKLVQKIKKDTRSNFFFFLHKHITVSLGLRYLAMATKVWQKLLKEVLVRL